MVRGQSGFKLVQAIVVVALVAIGLFVLYISTGYGYESRAMVNDAIGESASMREGVMKFRQSQGRWPEVADAAKFKADRSQLRRARSIDYDPAKHAVVITMEPQVYAGKRFAFYGQDGPDGPSWSCRAIDIETKHLPAACR